MSNPGSLLRQYVDHGSEPAFTELVAAHMDLVYSTALRKAAGDTHLARDISQRVFIDLAHKAASLPAGVVLPGWLHRHTCLTAAMMLRSEYRRRAREQTAAEMNEHQTSSPDADATWSTLAPALDDAVNQLAAGEREAVLLRFYERRDLRAVGAALGISDDAAQKRVTRALEKLRGFLSRRGITLSVVALASVMTERGVQAAPVGFAATTAALSLATPAVVPSLWMIMKTMLANKTVVATGLAVLALLVGPLYLRSSGQNSSAPAKSPPTIATPASSPGGAEASLASTPAATSNAVPVTETRKLRLAIVAADSGKVIPTVDLDYRVWIGKEVIEKKLASDRAGVCEVIYPTNNLRLDLTTRVEGFADTQLFWETSKGDLVPTNYVLRVIRPESIGGLVVDPAGAPVSGVTVSFSVSITGPPKSGPESHVVGIKTTTDETGRWHLNRFAPEVLGQIQGAARHPDYADSEASDAEHGAEGLAQLRAGTHVFTMRTPITVQGLVVDSGGQPVPDATVYFGERNFFPTRRARTSEDGSFKITGCRAGPGPVTVEAHGFAHKAIASEAKENAEPLRIILERGRLLRLRVVDQTGQPVPGAFVSLGDNYNWGPNNPVGTVANFTTETDAEGRAKWEGVPSGDYAFNFQAAGFTRLTDVKLVPDGTEQTVTMDSETAATARVVTGTVRDTDTGRGIPKFKVLASPTMNPLSSGPTNILWEIVKFEGVTYTEGRFRHMYRKAVSNSPVVGYVLRFEANGYLPAFSRFIGLTETNVNVEVSLQPAKPATITVRLPDGSPAANAKAALLGQSKRARITPGNLTNIMGETLIADAQGQLLLRPESDDTSLVIAHPQGFLYTALTTVIEQGQAQLLAWGRIEGHCERDGRPLTGRKFTIFPIESSLYLRSEDFEATSDAEGRFVIPQLPPGAVNFARAMAPVETGGRGGYHSRRRVEVLAGEATMIKTGDQDWEIVARTRWPNNAAAPAGLIMDGNVDVFVGAPPPEIEAQTSSMERSRQAMLRDTQSGQRFPIHLDADGVVRADEILPGKYILTLTARAAQAGGQSSVLFQGTLPVTVPANPATGTIDAGEIVMRPVESAARVEAKAQ